MSTRTGDTAKAHQKAKPKLMGACPANSVLRHGAKSSSTRTFFAKRHVWAGPETTGRDTGTEPDPGTDAYRHVQTKCAAKNRPQSIIIGLLLHCWMQHPWSNAFLLLAKKISNWIRPRNGRMTLVVFVGFCLTLRVHSCIGSIIASYDAVFFIYR